ncbi:molybdate ABC transporter substrate-binding protein [Vibrio ulleungensis]|uniref:Molybdate ABC transporter substrate-binding protein n=1 Tax=Vibrio ulleungensis TaxID=2807619 RepID=A0ABS2HIE9_9VIBR|nr:molybdate ABC transporter substrate-binding protein [Vibrio ulleungensis]MBM7035596.1 molybdate ABC transporter substrate-binding protein [Vibrio ulleungensis]
MCLKKLRFIIGLAIVTLSLEVSADTVRVAVANNFFGPLKALAIDYKEYSGDELIVSTGSTGQLYAQITQGAPFDVFLSADAARPQKLVDAGLAVHPFTYAYGQLVFWSLDRSLLSNDASSLTSAAIQYLALPNPKLAPYGAAAIQVMEKTNNYASLESKLVEGKNLSVVYQFVTTGNAQAGFLSMSQIYRDGEFIDGSFWVIPSSYYQPIAQNAVILSAAIDNNAVSMFVDYLKGPRAKQIMSEFGYL